LANLAQMNAKNCNIEHDACHNTQSFRLSGQNMALISNNRNDFVVDNEIESVINQWFDEYKQAHSSDVEAFDNRG
jgi:hypothetical protein